MQYLQFMFLGFLQGVTEFLPISSSGHLLLFSTLFGIDCPLFVSILLHFATLLSVCVMMRKELWQLVKKPFSKDMLRLIVSTLVSFVVVLLLYETAEASFVVSFLPFFFMITAVLLILTDIFAPTVTKPIDGKVSVIMGLAQGLALFPGVSRSGSTICAGVLSGGEKEQVAKHSFLMSLPIILASLVKELFEFGKVGSLVQIQILPLLFGMAFAFVFGVFALKFMIKLTCKLRLKYFGFYLIALSVVSLFV